MSRAPEEEEITADLCIVGAGPAGITIASELDGTGLRICLVEGGGVDIDRRAQRDCRGESDGYPLRRLHHSRIRAFGGALRSPRVGHDGWAARPLDPIDFEVRPGIAHTGWPITRDHLEPYYARAQARCGLATYAYEPDDWSDGACAPMPLEGSEVETTVFQFGQPAFHGALGPLTASSDVRVLLSSRVVDLVVDGDDRRIGAVRIRRPDGSQLVVRARVVVLAAGGIENARLLLAAEGMRGFGNEHDLVGRFFAERVSAHVGHILPARPELLAEAAFYRQHRVSSASVCGALRVADKVQRDRTLLNCVFFVLPRPAAVTTDAVRSLATLRKVAARRPILDRAGLYRHAGNVLRGVSDIGRFATGRDKGSQVLTLRAQGEQAPNRESRVTLGRHRDEVGMPVARVTWRITDEDRASVRSSLEIIDATLRGRGLGLVKPVTESDPLIEGNYHQMGTTRMHGDPRLGVVDADCRVHSVPNLYIAGSSVFPTYGSSNPTLTVVALAVRLADHLREELTRR